jgi:hypothetical protein
VLTDNSAQDYWEGYGGGAYISTLNNCTLTGNHASLGGGANSSTLNNCIIYFNTDHYGPNPYLHAPNHYSCALNYCCSTCEEGCASVTSDPLFVNQANGDFHLQTNSPCINAGNNTYATSLTDLDNNPRIQGGTVDIGAYEYQKPTSIISYAWLQQYGLPIDGSADFIDTDGDGMNNWQEWIAGTNPTNRLSVLEMLAPSNSVSGFTLTWQSVSGKTYYLQRGTDLLFQAASLSIQSNIVGQAGTTSFTDTTVTNGGPYFYRVGVQQ